MKEIERFIGRTGGVEVYLLASFTRHPPEIGLVYRPPGDCVVVHTPRVSVAQLDWVQARQIAEFLLRAANFAAEEQEVAA
jgi:hypothetical protein